MTLDTLKHEDEATRDRNKQRRFQIKIAMGTNLVITCQVIAAVWSPELRDSLKDIWPIMSTIYVSSSGLIGTYLFLGSQENRHSAELSAIRDDPRLRRNFQPRKSMTVQPSHDRDDTPEE